MIKRHEKKEENTRKTKGSAGRVTGYVNTLANKQTQNRWQDIFYVTKVSFTLLVLLSGLKKWQAQYRKEVGEMRNKQELEREIVKGLGEGQQFATATQLMEVFGYRDVHTFKRQYLDSIGKVGETKLYSVKDLVDAIWSGQVPTKRTSKKILRAG